MEKKFHFVSDIMVTKIKHGIAIGAGIVLTFFTCPQLDFNAEKFSQISESQINTSRESVYNDDLSVTFLENKNSINNQTYQSVASIDGGLEDVLSQFVSSVIRESKPLEGDFSKFVSDHFWDLI